MPYRNESILETMETYGQRLERALEHARRERKELSTYLGVSVQAISQVILGATKALTAENSAKAARFLGVNSYWLATGEGRIDEQEAAWPFERIDPDAFRQVPPEDMPDLEGAMILAAKAAGYDITKKSEPLIKKSA